MHPRCQPLALLAVVRAERASDGTVSQDRQQIAYIGGQDANRVADVVLDPGHQYIVGCGLQLRDGVTYWSGVYQPVVLQRVQSRWR